MPEQPSSLQQYPGYYPAGTKKFWTRTKVGTAAGVVGLLFGVALGGSSTDTKPPSTSKAPVITQADIDAAVASATSDLDARLEQQEDEAAAAARKSAEQAERQQAKAIKVAVAKARREERARAAKAVAKARQEATAAAEAAAQQAQAAPPAPQPLASTGGNASGGTDPRFSYCYEANDAGYGPYTQGQDPEYDWYDDADNDGVVCET